MRRERGVTLVEFVVMLAILGLVIGGIYQFVVNGTVAAGKTNNFLQSQAQVRAALDNIVDESRWASAVTAATATSVTLSIPQNTPFSASSPYAVTFTYDPVNRVVTRQQDAGPAVPMAYLVVGPGAATGLTFIYFDGGNNSLGSSPTAGQLSGIARLRAIVATTSGTVTRTLAGDAALRAHP
ncbi:MAG TPA: prepilin-type N-terminal cleavage/methylation domain-containing protein [bacterium]|nr:prepilin-type N-terminal cleavage/methylation domain-containing protein [bacterium]